MASSIMLGTFKFRNLYFYVIYYIKENDTLLYISRKKTKAIKVSPTTLQKWKL